MDKPTAAISSLDLISACAAGAKRLQNFAFGQWRIDGVGIENRYALFAGTELEKRPARLADADEFFPSAGTNDSYHLYRHAAARLHVLDASAGRWENLMRGTTVLRIERTAQPQHLLQIGRAKQLRHEIQLLDADAVLAGDAAAAGDALVQDFRARFQHAPHLIRIALVEQDHRMDVAVAGVEDVADPQIVLLFDLAHPVEHVRQFRPWDDAVLRA